MREVDLCTPLFSPSKVLKLRTVVSGNTLENIVKMVAILGMERSHSRLHGLAGLAGDLHGNVVVCHSLNER